MQTELIKKYNDKIFKDVMTFENFDSICYKAYDEHVQKTDVDFWHIDNITPPSFNFTEEELGPSRPFFPTTNNGFTRTYIPTAESMMIIKEVDRQGDLASMFKTKFAYDNCKVDLHIQHPGQMVAVHIDYNRSLLGDYPEKSKELLIREMKRHVYFLQDQEIGQTFTVGRQQVSWKAGDIIAWPWYVPHATANASEKDRHILTTIGYGPDDWSKRVKFLN